MTSERKIHAELCYGELFDNDAMNGFFKKECETRGWDCLFYSNGDKYHEGIVRRFYDCRIDYEEMNGKMTLYWDNDSEPTIITPDFLVEKMGISAHYGPQTKAKQSCDYRAVLGERVEIDSANRVRVCSLQVNQILIYRWICDNVIGSSNFSTIYEPGGHIQFMLMKRDSKICLGKTIMKNIMERKNANHGYLILPAFITRLLCELELFSDEIVETEGIELKEGQIPRQILHCPPGFWEPSLLTDEGELVFGMTPAHHDPDSPPPYFENTSVFDAQMDPNVRDMGLTLFRGMHKLYNYQKNKEEMSIQRHKELMEHILTLQNNKAETSVQKRGRPKSK